jgi:hypothetical protein
MRLNRVAAFLIALTCLVTVSDVAAAEVVQDTVYTINTWSFRTGDCGCPPCIGGCSGFEWSDYFDMVIVFIFSPPLGTALHAYSGVIPLGDVPNDSVRQAPLTGYTNDINSQENEEFQVNHTYIVKSAEGGHAVIRTTYVNPFGDPPLRFIYKYQDDGTGNFYPQQKAPTVPETWSAIKSLYR